MIFIGTGLRTNSVPKIFDFIISIFFIGMSHTQHSRNSPSVVERTLNYSNKNKENPSFGWCKTRGEFYTSQWESLGGQVVLIIINNNQIILICLLIMSIVDI